MFQQVIVIGYLGNDPEAKQLQGGSSVTNFSVAASEKWKDKNSGEQQERTEWFRCQAFGRTGEIAAEYLRKGSLVTVIGRLNTREYEDKEGVKRYATNLNVSELKLMPNGEKGGERPQRSSGQQTSRRQPQADEGFDDEIPF